MLDVVHWSKQKPFTPSPELQKLHIMNSPCHGLLDTYIMEENSLFGVTALEADL